MNNRPVVFSALIGIILNMLIVDFPPLISVVASGYKKSEGYTGHCLLLIVVVWLPCNLKQHF